MLSFDSCPCPVRATQCWIQVGRYKRLGGRIRHKLVLIPEKGKIIWFNSRLFYSTTLQNGRIAEHKSRESLGVCLLKFRTRTCNPSLAILHTKQLANYTNGSAIKSYKASTNLPLIFRGFVTNFTQNCVLSLILPMIYLGGKRHYSSILQTYRKSSLFSPGNRLVEKRHVIEVNQSTHQLVYLDDRGGESREKNFTT